MLSVSRSGSHTAPETVKKREAAYRAALYRHLIGEQATEIDFFVNSRRFDLMRAQIGRELARRPLAILNAASGPFAFEFYAGGKAAHIRAFDRDLRLMALHAELRHLDLIPESTFAVQNIGDFEADETFDVVLANDVFFAPEVDLFRVIGPLAAAVREGGSLYFDVQDVRAAPIWRAFGKNLNYRRYDLNAVRSAVEDHGLTVESVVPSFGIKGGADELARRALWKGCKVANNSAFVCRRPA